MNHSKVDFLYSRFSALQNTERYHQNRRKRFKGVAEFGAPKLVRQMLEQSNMSLHIGIILNHIILWEIWIQNEPNRYS